MTENKIWVPEGWDRVELAVDPKTGEYYILKCRLGRDQDYPAIEALKKKISRDVCNEARIVLEQFIIKQGLTL